MTTNETLDMHRPTAEFRDFLEGELIREYRHRRTFRRLRAAAVILVSVGVGMSATLASAQVRQTGVKDSLIAAAQADASLASVRLEIAKAELADAQKRVQAGARHSSELGPAEMQVRVAEAEVGRLALDLAEIQASALPPRDEMNAPVIGGRDFVKQRLQLKLMLAQQRLNLAEQARDEMAQRIRVGSTHELEIGEPELAVARARRDFAALAERLQARAQFVEKGTPVEELTRRIERVEVQQEIMLTQRAIENAQRTLAWLERGKTVGSVREVEVLRGRLAVAERQLELQRLLQRLDRLR
jgi:hypothetical protein